MTLRRSATTYRSQSTRSSPTTITTRLRGWGWVLYQQMKNWTTSCSRYDHAQEVRSCRCHIKLFCIDFVMFYHNRYILCFTGVWLQLTCFLFLEFYWHWNAPSLLLVVSALYINVLIDWLIDWLIGEKGKRFRGVYTRKELVVSHLCTVVGSLFIHVSWLQQKFA